MHRPLLPKMSHTEIWFRWPTLKLFPNCTSVFCLSWFQKITHNLTKKEVSNWTYPPTCSIYKPGKLSLWQDMHKSYEARQQDSWQWQLKTRVKSCLVLQSSLACGASDIMGLRRNVSTTALLGEFTSYCILSFALSDKWCYNCLSKKSNFTENGDQYTFCTLFEGLWLFLLFYFMSPLILPQIHYQRSCLIVWSFYKLHKLFQNFYENKDKAWCFRNTIY